MVETLVVRSVVPARQWRFNLWPAVVYVSSSEFYFLRYLRRASLSFFLLLAAGFRKTPSVRNWRERQRTHLLQDGARRRRGKLVSYLVDRSNWNWNLRGRTVPGGESAARLRSAGLPAENGYAGSARGGGREFNTLRRIVLHTPTQAELGWGTLGSLDRRDNPGRFEFHELGAVGTGSAGFRC